MLACCVDIKVGGADRQVLVCLSVFQEQPNIVFAVFTKIGDAAGFGVEGFDVGKRYAFTRCGGDCAGKKSGKGDEGGLHRQLLAG